jgi:phenylalanyl-tRNA synthetase beta chain
MGFSEFMCNSLTRSDYASLLKEIQAENWVKILNPLSKDLEVLRASLVFGALETLVWNYNRKYTDLKLFEYGSIYKNTGAQDPTDALKKYYEEEQLSLLISGRVSPANWHSAEVHADFYYLKASVHQVLKRFGLNSGDFRAEPLNGSDIYQYGLTYYDQQDEAVVDFGEIATGILKHFDIRVPVYYAAFHWEKLIRAHLGQRTRYAELPRFPEVRRDLALLLDKSVQYSRIEELAWKRGTRLLKKLDLFDVYEGEGIGEGKKSYAVSFILQDMEKTLTDEDIDKVMNSLIKAFNEELGAVLR